MWLPSTVSVAPASDLLDIDQAKQFLRVDGADEDELIEALIGAAQARVEALCGVRFITQTIVMRADDWADMKQLPDAPLQSVSSIAYVDSAGDAQTLSTDVYSTRLYGLTPQVFLKADQSWPDIEEGSLITVTAVAGYGAATAVPASLAAATKLVLSDLFTFRETAQVGSVAGVIPSSATVDNLIANYRRYLNV